MEAPNYTGFDQQLRHLFGGELCAVCGKPYTGGKGLLCVGCSEELRRAMRRICMKCGSSYYGCYCTPPQLFDAGCEYLVKLAAYNPSEPDAAVNRIIQRLKENRDYMLCRMLAGLLAEPVRRLMSARGLTADNCVIAYVPRSRRKLRETGQDQAYALARALSGATGIRCRRLLLRVREGAAQKTLGAAEREKNVEGLFTVTDTDRISGHSVILADDLVTSGSTLAECCRRLMSAGADSVYCVCIAQTVHGK